MEVGYGLEGVLPDSKVGYIGTNYLVPALKRGAWGQGIIDMLNQVKGEIKGENKASGNALGLPMLIFPSLCMWIVPFAFLAFIIWLFVRNNRRFQKYGPSRSYRGGGRFGGFGGGGFGGGGGGGGFSGGGGSSGGGGAGGSF